MRIKRTFAPTMREALQLVKQEQGPDAVILGALLIQGIRTGPALFAQGRGTRRIGAGVAERSRGLDLRRW